MEPLLTDDYENRVIRLLERIESEQRLLKLCREATEPSQLMIEETIDLLQRYVNELDTLMQQYGRSVQLAHERAA